MALSHNHLIPHKIEGVPESALARIYLKDHDCRGLMVKFYRALRLAGKIKILPFGRSKFVKTRNGQMVTL